MKPETVKWLLSGIVATILTASSYLAVETLPAVAALEAKADNFQHDNDVLRVKLDQICDELGEINQRLARIETKLGN